MTTLTKLIQWEQLKQHAQQISPTHLRDLFIHHPERAQQFSLETCGLYADFSKQKITQETINLLLDLAQACQLPQAIEDLFGGQKVNHTEEREALHVALRAEATDQYYIANKDILPQILRERQEALHFAEQVHQGNYQGYSGKPITDIVNIGIGGSELGPHMVCSALKDFAHIHRRVHFVSGIDGVQLKDLFNTLQAEHTLFIISSKSFTTQETLTNATIAINWLKQQATLNVDQLAKHLIAVTANIELAKNFGIIDKHIFPFHDWVGGRYSLWSSIGLPIAMLIGTDHFLQLLAGARAMDIHFRNTPLAHNLPILLALLDIWNINFLDTHSLLIAPYQQRLHRLPAYLQQLILESNGKSIDRQGTPVDYATSPVVWGETGTNGQHAYFQMVHQGTLKVYLDFIGICQQDYLQQEHLLSLSHLLAQSRALMWGRTQAETKQNMLKQGVTTQQCDHLITYRTFNGDRSSNTILLDKLTPFCLGSLLAMYEHRTYVQSVIWNINCFDQWGVEFGKHVSKDLFKSLQQLKQQGSTTMAHLDSSTTTLIQYLMNKHRQ